MANCKGVASGQLLFTPAGQAEWEKNNKPTTYDYGSPMLAASTTAPSLRDITALPKAGRASSGLWSPAFDSSRGRMFD